MSYPEKNQLKILNVLGFLLTGIASFLLIEKGWNLLSVSILLLGLLFIFLAYKKFRQINKNGSVMAFLYPDNNQFMSESDLDFAFYRSLVLGLLISFIGAVGLIGEFSIISVLFVVYGIASIAEALRHSFSRK